MAWPGRFADPSPPWTFKIGGDLPVHRLGFGAMRITGPGIWGEPADRAEAIRTLRRARELGIDFIDTADSYGPDVSERLIREALHPYGNVRVATKAGLARTGPDRWVALGRPEYLVQQAAQEPAESGRRADRPLAAAPDRSPGAGRRAVRRRQGDARAGAHPHAGLSEVTVRNIKAASKHFKVSTVQNRYNLTERKSEDVLAYCAEHGIGFIPWFPLAAGALAGAVHDTIEKIAKRHGATPTQIVLAWTLRKSPVTLPIPGTSRVDHLEENVATARIVLSDAEMAALDDVPASS